MMRYQWFEDHGGLTRANGDKFTGDLVGQFVPYDMAIATQPGGVAHGFFCMTPGFVTHRDDPSPAVKEFARDYQRRFGREPNFHGEAGYTAAISFCWHSNALGGT